jgi:hypothetical protein
MLISFVLRRETNLLEILLYVERVSNLAATRHLEELSGFTRQAVVRRADVAPNVQRLSRYPDRFLDSQSDTSSYSALMDRQTFLRTFPGDPAKQRKYSSLLTRDFFTRENITKICNVMGSDSLAAPYLEEIRPAVIISCLRRIARMFPHWPQYLLFEGFFRAHRHYRDTHGSRQDLTQ